MMSHKEIWRAIDALAQKSGLSVSGLARKAGLDPTAFNKSKRLSPAGHMRWPTTESIARVLECTDTSLADFLMLIGEKASSSSEAIPIIDLKSAAQPGCFDDKGIPLGNGWEQILFPAIEDKSIYAVEILGDDHTPVFRDGTLIIVSPTAQIRKGDRVLLKKKSGEILVREFLRKTLKTMELYTLTCAQNANTLPLSEIEWICRIIWAAQ